MSDIAASDLAAVLETAQKRGRENNFTYAGALNPQEAFAVLSADAKALLIDVRTKAELELVGRVPGALHTEWATFPGMVANPEFVQQLQAQLAQEGADANSVLIFMCRTGGRSHNAAAVAASLGFKQAYNMLQGFEGEANQFKQRTLINGWKFAGLPWTN